MKTLLAFSYSVLFSLITLTISLFFISHLYAYTEGIEHQNVLELSVHSEAFEMPLQWQFNLKEHLIN